MPTFVLMDYLRHFGFFRLSELRNITSVLLRNSLGRKILLGSEVLRKGDLAKSCIN